MDEDRHAAQFRSWVEQYTPLIARIARAYTSTEDDGQDLMQETLLQLWQSIPRFGGRCGGSTWIYRVALNTALAWQRKDRRRRLRFPPLAESVEAPDPPDQSAETRDRQEIVERLYAAIRQLPKTDAALVLLYLDDLSYREMAEVLGISESHVGVKLNRARKRLGELMQEVAYGA